MKIRLYAQPPGRASILLEVDLPEAADDDAVKLKCFSPPPNNQADLAQYGKTRAWAVTLEAEDVSKLGRLSEAVRIVPFGDAKPRGGGWPVELSFSSGQAEARLTWWMRAPAAWTAVQEIITEMMDLSEREASGESPSMYEPDDEEDEDGRDEDDERDDATGPPRAATGRKKGFFGRLLGG